MTFNQVLNKEVTISNKTTPLLVEIVFNNYEFGEPYIIHLEYHQFEQLMVCVKEVEAIEQGSVMNSLQAHRKALDEFHRVSSNPLSTEKELKEASNRLSKWENERYK